MDQTLNTFFGSCDITYSRNNSVIMKIALMAAIVMLVPQSIFGGLQSIPGSFTLPFNDAAGKAWASPTPPTEGQSGGGVDEGRSGNTDGGGQSDSEPNSDTQTESGGEDGMSDTDEGGMSEIPLSGPSNFCAEGSIFGEGEICADFSSGGPRNNQPRDQGPEATTDDQQPQGTPQGPPPRSQQCDDSFMECQNEPQQCDVSYSSGNGKISFISSSPQTEKLCEPKNDKCPSGWITVPGRSDLCERIKSPVDPNKLTIQKLPENGIENPVDPNKLTIQKLPENGIENPVDPNKLASMPDNTILQYDPITGLHFEVPADRDWYRNEFWNGMATDFQHFWNDNCAYVCSGFAGILGLSCAGMSGGIGAKVCGAWATGIGLGCAKGCGGL